MYYHYGKWFRGCPLLGGDKCTITMGSGRGCPLLGGDKCTITMGSGSEVVLFLEVKNALSLWEVDNYLSLVLFRGCPLFMELKSLSDAEVPL